MKKIVLLACGAAMFSGTAATAQGLGDGLIRFHPYYQKQHLELGYVDGSGDSSVAISGDLSINVPFFGFFQQEEPFGGGLSQPQIGLNLGVRGFSFNGTDEIVPFGGVEYLFAGGNRALVVGSPDAAYDDYLLRTPFMLSETVDDLTANLAFGSFSDLAPLLFDEYSYGIRYDARANSFSYGLSLHRFNGATSVTYGGILTPGGDFAVASALEIFSDDGGDTDVGGQLGLRYEPSAIAGLGLGLTGVIPVSDDELSFQVDLDYDFAGSGSGLPLTLAASYIDLSASSDTAFSIGAEYRFTDTLSVNAAYGDTGTTDLYSINLVFRPTYGNNAVGSAINSVRR